MRLTKLNSTKKKKSFAPVRPYTYSGVYLIGFIERSTRKILIFPTVKRSTEIFIPLLLRHVEVKSVIYTDSYSVYVNNQRQPPESKLMEYGYIHKFINHKQSFVNEIFKDIHTNTIERFWRTIKEHLKKHKVESLYLLCIGRFYFHRSLDKLEQLNLLSKSLNFKSVFFEDLEF